MLLRAREMLFVCVLLGLSSCATALRPGNVPRTPPAPRASVSEPTATPRQGRVPLALLAAAGALETGAITADKLSGAGALDGLCSAVGGGCADVLNGPWASVAGVPLSLVGAVAYSTVAALAAAPLVSPEYEEPSAGPLVFGSAALATFSGCLMLLLATVIQEPCVLCFTSAAISASLLAVAWKAPLLADRTQAAVVAGGGALMSVAAAALLYGVVGPDVAAASSIAAEGAPPTIRSKSSPRALALAEALNQRDAKFYGAYWCSHCANQKETLGREAMKLVPYLECDAQGLNSKRDQCQAAGIKGYPTWSVNGELFPGEKDLDELADLLAGKLTPQKDD